MGIKCQNCGNEDSYSCISCHSILQKTKSFAEAMNDSWVIMEKRVESLEADVKRLKRELGLK